jgi:hypothetical protein
MSSAEPGEEETLEIIDRRRPAAHPAKYFAFATVAVVFVVCGYMLLLHFTPREFAGAAISPLEKSALLTSRFLEQVGKVVASSRVSTTSKIEVGRVTAMDKLGPLIVARQELAVKFTNVDERIFGTSSAEVQAVGHAFYFVPLLDAQARWKIEAMEKDGVRVCIVHAPALRMLTPINVDTRSLEIRTKTGALRSNQQEMTEAAIADITPRLQREALAHEVDARSAARKTIATFVKNWLTLDANWGLGRINAIQVLFPGETAIDTDFAIPGFYDRP